MKRVDRQLFNKLLADAEASPRRRSHHLLHESHDDQVQKLVVGMMPDSYVRPHLHPQKGKFELFTVLQGSFRILIFDPHCTVTEIVELSEGGD